MNKKKKKRRKSNKLYSKAYPRLREKFSKKKRAAGGAARAPKIGSNLAKGYNLVIGNYITYVNKSIGSGSHGRIYESISFELETNKAFLTALKKIKCDAYGVPPCEEVFTRECDYPKRIKHENIVSIYDCIVQPENNTLILMEYFDLGSITELIENMYEKGLNLIQLQDFDPLKYIIICILDGLSVIHANYTHFDIKLENILINTDGDIKIGDFGGLSDINNSYSRIEYSPQYMAPCIPDCIHSDKNPKTKCVNTDFWAVAIILLELITGRKIDIPLSQYLIILTLHSKVIYNIFNKESECKYNLDDGKPILMSGGISELKQCLLIKEQLGITDLVLESIPSEIKEVYELLLVNGESISNIHKDREIRENPIIDNWSTNKSMLKEKYILLLKRAFNIPLKKKELITNFEKEVEKYTPIYLTDKEHLLEKNVPKKNNLSTRVSTEQVMENHRPQGEQFGRFAVTNVQNHRPQGKQFGRFAVTNVQNHRPQGEQFGRFAVTNVENHRPQGEQFGRFAVTNVENHRPQGEQFGRFAVTNVHNHRPQGEQFGRFAVTNVENHRPQGEQFGRFAVTNVHNHRPQGEQFGRFAVTNVHNHRPQGEQFGRFAVTNVENHRPQGEQFGRFAVTNVHNHRPQGEQFGRFAVTNVENHRPQGEQFGRFAVTNVD